jgi:Glycosyl hydrolase family 26
VSPWTAGPGRLIGIAAVGLAIVAGLVGWALYPAHPGAGRPAAEQSRQARPTASAPAQVLPSSARPAPSATPATPSPSPSSSPPKPRPPAQHIDGAFTAGLRFGVFTAGQSLPSFDAQVGQAALTVTYVQWGTPVRWLAHVIATAAASQAAPILELYPGAFGHDASQIAAGTGGSDAWLSSFGRTIARAGDPVVISFFPEMNGSWRASWSHGPANYVRAFRHVHQVLSGLAGSLITWFWQPSAMHNSNPSPMPWWPGAGYADVVALDGYYYFPHDDFAAIFGATIRLVRQADPTIPIMVGETAAGPMFDRQSWEITDLFAGIRRYGLLGLVWFNRSQHMQPYEFHQDWRLQDHPVALAAFRACLARYGPLARLVR